MHTNKQNIKFLQKGDISDVFDDENLHQKEHKQYFGSSALTEENVDLTFGTRKVQDFFQLCPPLNKEHKYGLRPPPPVKCMYNT